MRRFQPALRAAFQAVLAIAASAAACAPIAAQTEYYNLDAAHAVRIEDASAAQRYALEFVLSGLRLERFAGGARRWRSEPKVVYGVLPFTEVEIRAPIVHVVGMGGRSGSTGLGGFGIGATHAFNLETGALPALALSSELLLPWGNLSGGVPSYSVKGLLTRTTMVGRLHLNVAIGSWAVRATAPTPPPSCGLVTINGVCSALVTTPIDLPCSSDIAPIAAAPNHEPSVGKATAAASVSPRSHGARWMAGVAGDHTWPLASLLLSGNVYAERFVGLYPLTDWTAEVGARHQWTPWLVFDLGAARRFSGSTRSAAATVGLTYVLATRRLESIRR